MKKICICGHFSFKRELLNGQTIKTKIICSELEKEYGSNTVIRVDTAGNKLSQIISLAKMVIALAICENIIILPARNGVKIIAPFLEKFNRLFKRRLHYIVIGGWLPEYIERRNKLSKSLKKFDYIYVETLTMKQALDNYGFKNIIVMPNFKDLTILQPEDLVYSYSPPFKLCTFSRVTKEKGISDIIEVVKKVNSEQNFTAYTLDIYGPIDKNYSDEFGDISKNFPKYIQYKGEVKYDGSVNILKQYFALVFPTKYYTEGVPGTIIDAYAAGVPVIASKWESFEDVVNDGITGIGYEFNNNDDLKSVLDSILFEPDLIIEMKKACLLKSKEYLISKLNKTLKISGGG